MVDVDGVISLFGFSSDQRPDGTFHAIDGIPHLLSATAGQHLLDLSDDFQLVWCTGWEEKANDYLPSILGLPGRLPCLRFEEEPVPRAHWKLAAIDAFAGPARALAWIDDSHDEHCDAWAAERPGPTLLIGTEPAVGVADEHVHELVAWAQRLG